MMDIQVKYDSELILHTITHNWLIGAMQLLRSLLATSFSYKLAFDQDEADWLLVRTVVDDAWVGSYCLG